MSDDSNEVEKSKILENYKQAKSEANSFETFLLEQIVPLYRDKLELFYKIALGSGAALTAITSFVASKNVRVYSPNALRTAAIGMLAAIIFSLLRNIIMQGFPGPFLLMRWADLRKQQFEAAGESVDVSQAMKLLSDMKKEQTHDITFVKRFVNLFEFLCFSSLICAAVSLAIILWKNLG